MKCSLCELEMLFDIVSIVAYNIAPNLHQNHTTLNAHSAQQIGIYFVPFSVQASVMGIFTASIVAKLLFMYIHSFSLWLVNSRQ